MSAFRIGTFDRSRLTALRKLCPSQSCETIYDIDLDALKTRNKKLILLDVDNTILPWKSEDYTSELIAWVSKVKAAGLQLCILSNTRHPARLLRICAKLEIDHIRDKFKPSKRMYEIALARYGIKKEEAVMVGDQLFTDILGANRTGIDAIWVKPIAYREFAGTKISRLGERLVRKRLYKAIVTRQVKHK